MLLHFTVDAPCSLADGKLFVANGDDGEMVEINVRSGRQIDADFVDTSGGPPPGAGALFGLWAVSDERIFFVDDATNTFNLLR